MSRQAKHRKCRRRAAPGSTVPHSDAAQSRQTGWGSKSNLRPVPWIYEHRNDVPWLFRYRSIQHAHMSGIKVKKSYFDRGLIAFVVEPG